MPHVSVVIPIFNSAPLIGTALRSVFAQTFRDFEVILVDDGSEDHEELSAALAEWEERIHYIRQPNGGPARARNTGIAGGTGDLIAFLDADDEWLPNKLARQVEYFDRYSETGLLHTALVGDTRAGSAVSGPPTNAFCDLFHTVFFVSTPTVMVPRRALHEVGGFDERREIHIEDWDLWLRIAADYPIGYIPEPLAIHRPGGLMSRQVDRTYAAQALVIEKNRELCKRACAMHRAAPHRCDRTRRYVLHRDWAYDRLEAGDRRGAREQLRRALACSPWAARSALVYLSTFMNDRWRARVRDVIGARWRGRRERAPAPNPPVPPPARSSTGISLVHDTVYRRFRRRMIARLHDLDDGISRMRPRKRILFDAASPMSFAVFRPIYERLRHDPRLELWFTAYGDVWQPHEIFAPAGIIENVVARSTASAMKVDAYVNTDLWDMTWLHRRTRRIHLFHGVAGKYALDAPVDLAPNIAAFDCLMFVNADRRRRYIEAGLVPDEDVKAALVGYPKVDCLVDGSLNPAGIARALALDPAASTVIYAPTWSPYSSLNAMGEEIIERLAADGLQVIVKLHDRSYDRLQRGSGGVDWAVRLSKYDAHPLVRVIRQADASPLLAVSDAMVSDHSSIAFEYMLLDRPIVAIDCPELIEQAGINPDKVRRLRSAAYVVRSARDMTNALVNALRNPGRLSAERRRIAADLFYRPGTATDRAVALIYRMIDLPAFADGPAAVEPARTLSAVG
jgi:glycosyltransferase involved in cell wall biosynthesis